MQTYEQFVCLCNRLANPECVKDQECMTAVLKKHYRTRNLKFQCFPRGVAHVFNTYLVSGGEPEFLDL